MEAGVVEMGEAIMLLRRGDAASRDQAWLAMAQMAERPEERRYCLRQALAENGRNWAALGMLVEIGDGPVRCPETLRVAPPLPMPPPPLLVSPTDVEFPKAALPGAAALRSLVLLLLAALLSAAALRLPALPIY